MIIAIDGPAASGKSTVAREVARRLCFTYIDTGAMYRAITWKAIKDNISVDNEELLSRIARSSKFEITAYNSGSSIFKLDGQDVTEAIREPEVTTNVSAVSKIPGVRLAMVEQQRRYADIYPNVVVEGRDIGTVVFPNAELKIFLKASVSERAKRRHLELKAKGHVAEVSYIEKDIIRRDTIDSSREASPLIKAKDAHEIDTTSKTIEQVIDEIIRLAKDG